MVKKGWDGMVVTEDGRGITKKVGRTMKNVWSRRERETFDNCQEINLPPAETLEDSDSRDRNNSIPQTLGDKTDVIECSWLEDSKESLFAVVRIKNN